MYRQHDELRQLTQQKNQKVKALGNALVHTFNMT